MRLIDADALIEKLGIAKDCNNCKYNKEPYCRWKPDVIDIREAINEAPTIEPERKRGKWEKPRRYHTWCRCSECGIMPVRGRPNYCPNCGADMRGEQE